MKNRTARKSFRDLGFYALWEYFEGNEFLEDADNVVEARKKYRRRKNCVVCGYENHGNNKCRLPDETNLAVEAFDKISFKKLLKHVESRNPLSKSDKKWLEYNKKRVGGSKITKEEVSALYWYAFAELMVRLGIWKPNFSGTT